MNNNGPYEGPLFQPFDLTQHINVQVCISKKIHFMQRIVFMFGSESLNAAMASPNPIIVPLIHYNTSFDVHIFILF